MQFVNNSLRNILASFNCEVKKGFFPYKFVNKNNLFYQGPKPDIKLFEDISSKDYENLPANWDLKAESLEYLASDVKGLFEFVNKFSNSIYNDYGLNITKFLTTPSLTLGIYTSNYYDETKNKIKMVQGQVE